MEGEEVRALVRSHRPSSGSGYPDVVRQAVVAYTQQRRALGQRWDQIGEEVGLSSTTLSNWSRSQCGFVAVAVVEGASEVRERAPSLSPDSRGLILHTPNGFRLEGLDAQQALALLQVLR